MATNFFKTMLCVVTDCHNDVVKIVELASKHNVCLIPYGGESWGDIKEAGKIVYVNEAT